MRETARGALGRGRLLAAVLAACGAALCSALAPSGAMASYPVEAQFAAPGPYATTTEEVTNGEGKAIYETFRPSDYGSLGFKSPVVTWGNGTGAVPGDYSTLLSHLASYGFTVIATTRENTGSGVQIDEAARYLVAQNANLGSIFYGELNTSEVAAVGHSQGAGGAMNATTRDPSLYKALMTFSLPDKIWVSANEDCPAKEECEFFPEKVSVPTFLISTYGWEDAIIATPIVEWSYFLRLPAPAALGIVKESEGKEADHSSIENVADGGNPAGELGYATAWLEYRLLGNARAEAAFAGSSPELPANANWPGSQVK